MGAAFLMATSAIGPGFLTQTSLFTSQLLASFGFVILVSILLDIGAQVNIWRIITISEKRAQDLANQLLPGLGVFLAILIGFGGLVFNIGNVGGTGLGLYALSGLDKTIGAAISTLIAIGIFWYHEAARIIDSFVKWLGVLMILFTIYVTISSAPPIGEALYRTVWPKEWDVMKIVTIVGGTVGGYISFAGAHRLIDAGIKGREALPQVTRSAVSGIIITSIMRYILFLAALGVVWHGARLDNSNPAASVFQHAAGGLGYRFFGFVMWCAAITSVIGASYTSVSFFRTLHPLIEKNQKLITTIFILISSVIYILIEQPVTLLVLAGAVNGLVLPFALAVMLIAVVRNKLLNNYKHPLVLTIIGWTVVIIMTWFGWITIQTSLDKLLN